jgi:predicted molibdopterin-dependent oxidoreductase YjgC
VATLGAGGGTSSYEEIENTDLILLWGSNARNAHPIFFHHLLAGVRNGARLYVIDPRRSESAKWADVWLGIDVGSDIALANAMAKVIIDEGLAHTDFIDHATVDFDLYAKTVSGYTLERATEITGIPGEVIREMAIAYATAETAQICWTLGITEHHNATDNVLALISLAFLTGHVGRYGSGLVPIRGQNNVQGGGDMGALPNKLPGFQDVEDDVARGKFEATWGHEVPAKHGWHLTQMFEAMDADKLKGLYVIGENPAQSEANTEHSLARLRKLEFLVVQDIFLTKTAAMADVVFPAAADWCEAEGTVTSSERRVQRVRAALEPPGDARTDITIISMFAEAMGRGWGRPTAEEAWDELRSLSPPHAGMTYRRLDELGGLQWPCPSEDHPGSQFLHARLWSDDVGPPAPFIPVEHVPPVDRLTDEYPLRMTTGRHLDGYNTGVQSGGFDSPIRIGATIDVAPEDADRLGLEAGEVVRVASRRGSIEAPVRLDPGLRPGLSFMAVHYPDEVDVNELTIEAWDPKSGTSEFKATAVRIEKLARV